MWEFLILAVAGSLVLALFVWVVIYRAMGNLIDWLIFTFGNDSAVKRVQEERGVSRPETPPRTRKRNKKRGLLE
jgi:hypothetical protein